MNVLECKIKLKRKPTKNWLERNHFTFNRYLSDDDWEVYSRRNVVWKFGSAGVLESEYSVFPDGEVRVNVYDYGTRAPYASWYCRKYGKNDVVEIIDNKIINELEKLGAEFSDK